MADLGIIHLIVLGGIVEIDLEAVKHDKILVVQMILGDHYVVIGKGNDRIAFIYVYLFDLLGRLSPVRNIGMAMKIRFVKVSAFV